MVGRRSFPFGMPFLELRTVSSRVTDQSFCWRVKGKKDYFSDFCKGTFSLLVGWWSLYFVTFLNNFWLGWSQKIFDGRSVGFIEGWRTILKRRPVPPFKDDRTHKINSWNRPGLDFMSCPSHERLTVCRFNSYRVFSWCQSGGCLPGQSKLPQWEKVYLVLSPSKLKLRKQWSSAFFNAATQSRKGYLGNLRKSVRNRSTLEFST